MTTSSQQHKSNATDARALHTASLFDPFLAWTSCTWSIYHAIKIQRKRVLPAVHSSRHEHSEVVWNWRKQRGKSNGSGLYFLVFDVEVSSDRSWVHDMHTRGGKLWRNQSRPHFQRVVPRICWSFADPSSVPPSKWVQPTLGMQQWWWGEKRVMESGKRLKSGKRVEKRRHSQVGKNAIHSWNRNAVYCCIRFGRTMEVRNWKRIFFAILFGPKERYFPVRGAVLGTINLTWFVHSEVRLVLSFVVADRFVLGKVVLPFGGVITLIALERSLASVYANVLDQFA